MRVPISVRATRCRWSVMLARMHGRLLIMKLFDAQIGQIWVMTALADRDKVLMASAPRYHG